MEAVTKERFLARLYEMRSKQANNSRAITQEDYDNIIKKLKLLDKKVKGKSIPGFTSNDYSLPNNVCFKKNGTKHSSVLLLRFVPVFLKQTLLVKKKKIVKTVLF